MVHGKADGQGLLLFDAPLSRNKDCITSFLAAEKLLRSGKLRGQRKAVLRALRLNDGSTSAEISAKIGSDRYVASRRLPELEKAGLCARGQIRLCKVTRSSCLTWWIKDG